MGLLRPIGGLRRCGVSRVCLLRWGSLGGRCVPGGRGGSRRSAAAGLGLPLRYAGAALCRSVARRPSAAAAAAAAVPIAAAPVVVPHAPAVVPAAAAAAAKPAAVVPGARPAAGKCRMARWGRHTKVT